MIRRIALSLLLPWLVIISLDGCASSTNSANSGYRDYTMAVGTAYPEETQLAQDRVTRYLARLTPAEKERIAQNDYLAVVATEVPVGEVPGLSQKVVSAGLSQTGGLTDRASLMSKFIMIFDSKTGRSVSNEGFISLETPPKGHLGIFGGYTAVYIGTGQ